MQPLSSLDPAHQREALAQPYDVSAGLIMAAAFLVSIFYSLDALYGERRDRSILFWKSMPVSDLTTVLAKASIPVVVLPLLSFAITVVTQSIMLLLSSMVLLAGGFSVASLWTQLQLPQVLLMLLYHLVTAHMFWFAPFYAWLLLVSAWARRAPFLWAILPPLAIGIFEKVAFHSSYFFALINNRFSGGGPPVPPPIGRTPLPPPHVSLVWAVLPAPALCLLPAIVAAIPLAPQRPR